MKKISFWIARRKFFQRGKCRFRMNQKILSRNEIVLESKEKIISKKELWFLDSQEEILSKKKISF